jgi:hypothetical protein
MEQKQKHIPDYLYNKVVDYYKSDHWFYICHPLLGYKSPSKWISEGNSLEVLERIIDSETSN